MFTTSKAVDGLRRVLAPDMAHPAFLMQEAETGKVALEAIELRQGFVHADQMPQSRGGNQPEIAIPRRGPEKRFGTAQCVRVPAFALERTQPPQFASGRSWKEVGRGVHGFLEKHRRAFPPAED